MILKMVEETYIAFPRLVSERLLVRGGNWTSVSLVSSPYLCKCLHCSSRAPKSAERFVKETNIMGNVCCCMQVEEIQDYINRNPSTYRNCICFNCFVQNFVNVYTTLFRRGEVQAIPSSIEGAASRTTSASTEDSFSDMYRSPPRPLPYDVDPRSFCAQQRREKGSSHAHEESEPLRANSELESDSLHSGGKWKEYRILQEENIKAALKLSLAETTVDAGHFYATTAEDEDVCPTCLDEYTPENPKIVTKCSHHFHLGCIYEWMERSDSCPVCGKVMMFDETT